MSAAGELSACFVPAPQGVALGPSFSEDWDCYERWHHCSGLREVVFVVRSRRCHAFADLGTYLILSFAEIVECQRGIFAHSVYIFHFHMLCHSIGRSVSFTRVVLYAQGGNLRETRFFNLIASFCVQHRHQDSHTHETATNNQHEKCAKSLFRFIGMSWTKTLCRSCP